MSDSAGPRSDPKSSIRQRIMSHVIWPLGLVWLLGTLLSAGIANHFVQQAFDRSLLDDAYLVASHVRLRSGQGAELEINMSAAEINGLLFDQSESVAFAVFREDGSFLAGHPGLRTTVAVPDSASPFAFDNVAFQGRNMRAVLLRQSQPVAFSVIVAQTSTSRGRLLQNLLIYSVVPEVLLLLAIAMWLRWAIKRDLQPLSDLMQMVEKRDGSDLSPLRLQTNTRDMENLSGAVNALLHRIAKGLTAQKEFTGNVAHELRTPLAGIRALAELGLDSSDPDQLKAQLRQIRDSSIRAGHLTDQLLALAIADEADIALQIERLHLDELVTSAILQRTALARRADVDLGATGVDTPCEIWGNKALIEGILNNLLDNAIRYGRPPAPQRQEVTVCIRSSSEGVELVVIDNGPGIDPGDCEALVQRGVQGADRQGSNEGVGLGLSIVKRYAQLLGAEFFLQNAAQGSGLEAHLVFKQAAAPSGKD